ncbi:MAG: hypothetical protein H8D22_00380 [Candidatus Cloacimonetes bacterium]|nr:hypothetical protein [Candidatus Cloacimonadota bacterium]
MEIKEKRLHNKVKLSFLEKEINIYEMCVSISLISKNFRMKDEKEL